MLHVVILKFLMRGDLHLFGHNHNFGTFTGAILIAGRDVVVEELEDITGNSSVERPSGQSGCVQFLAGPVNFFGVVRRIHTL